MNRHGVEHGHSPGCGCGAHEASDAGSDRGGGWAMLAPILVCLVCPACLSTYAKAFAALGVGISLTDEEHTWLLALAVALSLAVSGWRSWRGRRVWPIGLAIVGCGMLLGGHLTSHHPSEWAGIGVLLVGGLVEQQVFRHRSARRSAALTHPAAQDA